MQLTSNGENTPDIVFNTRLRENIRFRAGNGGGQLHHLIEVIQDPLRAILRKDDQIQSRKTGLQTLDIIRDVLAVGHDLFLRVQTGHLIVYNCNAQSILARCNIAVSHNENLLQKNGSMNDNLE